jgi:hypothetical protein
VEAKLDVRLDEALQKLAPEPEPEPEPPVEEEEAAEDEQGGEEAVPPTQRGTKQAEQLVRQLGVALNNYEGFYGPDRHAWSAAENLTVGALCAQLAAAYDTMGVREYTMEYRRRAERYRYRAEELKKESTQPEESGAKRGWADEG